MSNAPLETRRPRARRRRVMLAVLLASAVATLGTASMSLALFTDSDSMDASWSAGTIVLGLDTTTAFNPTDILPGDSGTKTVKVSNTGTGELRYSMTSSTTATQGLGTGLQLKVETGACGSTTDTLYNSTLTGAAFGNPAAGQQLNDQVLAAHTDANLCFSWSFPSDAGNGYQGASASTVFTFASEQTAHNP